MVFCCEIRMTRLPICYDILTGVPETEAMQLPCATEAYIVALADMLNPIP
ncbi:hypothetical protein CYPRO_1406 [Cyclonatronum proteinivorum]|uniref:Uncharacterized protein n=1 Tax=Cyclonatronum proteinivorum TaxID=1457365 RepID=A0A345UJL0_9BACT|nr:hypothetical protein CYPRO_1406 [Cyclonatronum proteinivorum]